MVNTRAVTSSLSRNYLQKAQECFSSAQDAFAKSHWNSCIINAVHCGTQKGNRPPPVKDRWDARFARGDFLLSPGIFPATGERAKFYATGSKPVENSVISAADALTVFHLGQRCMGERHNEVLELIRQIEIFQGKTDLHKKIQQLSSLLGFKNQAEYEEKLMTLNEADLALKHAERFLSWVKESTR